MKSNSSYSITHLSLSLSLSLYFATGGGEEAAARRRRASSIGSLFFECRGNDENNKR